MPNFSHSDYHFTVSPVSINLLCSSSLTPDKILTFLPMIEPSGIITPLPITVIPEDSKSGRSLFGILAFPFPINEFLPIYIFYQQ